jgi:nickel transport protein
MPEKRLFSSRKPPVLWTPGILALLALVVFATPAWAHRVLIFAYAEGDTIHTESKFVPDTPVHQGTIKVIDKKTGKVLLTGKTDNQGKFSFKIPPAAAAQRMDLEIVVEAAMGHRGEWLLKAGSYLPGAKTPATVTPAVIPAPSPGAVPASPKAKAAKVNQQALEVTLNKALERQLAPINEKLTDLTIHRTSLPDILGGIGYIVGLFGLWAYFQSKRKHDA